MFIVQSKEKAHVTSQALAWSWNLHNDFKLSSLTVREKQQNMKHLLSRPAVLGELVCTEVSLMDEFVEISRV